MSATLIQPRKLDGFSSSRDTSLDHMCMTIYGPSSIGKTWYALTASAQWTGGATDIQDLVVLMFDRGGLDGVTSAGINVPYIDVNKWMYDQASNIEQALVYCTTKAAAAVHAGVRTIVVDTVSSLDRLLDAHFEVKTPAGPRKSFEKYNSMAIQHNLFYSALARLQADIVFLAHMKVGMLDSAKEQEKVRVAKVPGQYDVWPDITGKSLGTYTNNVSIEGHIVKKVAPDGTESRHLVIGDKESVCRTKNRFAGTIGPTEPAHLGQMLAKIRQKSATKAA